MGQHKTLHKAKKARYNEFYTPRETVEDFLPKIAPYLKGKSVWCFSDGFESEFTKWFIANFDAIGLHKLLCTSQSKDGGLAILKEAGQVMKS